MYSIKAERLLKEFETACKELGEMEHTSTEQLSTVEDRYETARRNLLTYIEKLEGGRSRAK